LKTFLWNLRFRLGWFILPGEHKHIAIRNEGEVCERCEAIYADLEDMTVTPR